MPAGNREVLHQTNVLILNTKKYFDYFFETKGFRVQRQTCRLSEQALRAAQLARGQGREPAIFVQGIMPRSGSVYVGELLRLHPDITGHPNHLWEFPANILAEDILRLQTRFIDGYRYNLDKFEDYDFLPIVGSALVAYLHSMVPDNQRVLVKMPSVQYLDFFFTLFPFENLVILVRDGRDLVHSTLKTWPYLNFLQVCLRWNRSVRIILETVKQFEANDRTGYALVKFEHALKEPQAFVREVCARLCLDETRYPFERIEEIRVIGSSKLENKPENQNKVSWQHLKRPKDFRPVEYWRKWSALRKLVFKTVAGKSLIELGYCRDLNW